MLFCSDTKFSPHVADNWRCSKFRKTFRLFCDYYFNFTFCHSLGGNFRLFVDPSEMGKCHRFVLFRDSSKVFTMSSGWIDLAQKVCAYQYNWNRRKFRSRRIYGNRLRFLWFGNNLFKIARNSLCSFESFVLRKAIEFEEEEGKMTTHHFGAAGARWVLQHRALFSARKIESTQNGICSRCTEHRSQAIFDWMTWNSMMPSKLAMTNWKCSWRRWRWRDRSLSQMICENSSSSTQHTAHLHLCRLFLTNFTSN